MTDKQENDAMPKIAVNNDQRAADDIDVQMRKLTQGLGQVTDARGQTERRQVEYHNQAQALLIESDERVAEIDRGIIIEEEYIDKARRGIVELTALVTEHGENLALLKIEKQARLNTIHELKSRGVSV
jgi:hypothetical protein